MSYRYSVSCGLHLSGDFKLCGPSKTDSTRKEPQVLRIESRGCQTIFSVDPSSSAEPAVDSWGGEKMHRIFPRPAVRQVEGHDVLFIHELSANLLDY